MQAHRAYPFGHSTLSRRHPVASARDEFAAILARDEEVTSRLGADRLAEMLDPARYTGDSARQAEEQAARGRRVAAELREAVA